MGQLNQKTLVPLFKGADLNNILNTQVNKMRRSNKRDRSKLAMLKREIEDKINSAIEKLNEMEKEKLAMLELEFQNSLMAIPKNVLNTVIDMKDERFRAFILGTEDISDEKDKKAPPRVISTAGRRRSRSASSTRASQRITSRIRSTSVDIYKTPRGRMRLSTIMSHKKYTVTKPKRIENTGLHLKRIMKPDEEAISISGSPLHVAPGNLHAPHVNIPLPGGVVLNIEPKSPKGVIEDIHLDPETKSQIKLLCKQLKKFC